MEGESGRRWGQGGDGGAGHAGPVGRGEDSGFLSE